MDPDTGGCKCRSNWLAVASQYLLPIYADRHEFSIRNPAENRVLNYPTAHA